MAYLELTPDQLDADSPVDETLMEQIGDNFVAHQANKLERDGTIPMTDDFYVGNNDIRQVQKIYLSDGSIFPDDYALLEGQSMIAAAFLGGVATSAGNGIVNDSGADFDGADAVTTSHLVNVPGILNELMFQISSVATTALTLKTSSVRVTGAEVVIPIDATYTVHGILTNQEWREIDQQTDIPTTIRNVSVDTDSRFLKLEIRIITPVAGTPTIELTYGDISALNIGDDDDTALIVYLRTKKGANNLGIHLTGAAPINGAEVTIYESVDVVNVDIA